MNPSARELLWRSALLVVRHVCLGLANDQRTTTND
jgi:hypothetical protein